MLCSLYFGAEVIWNVSFSHPLQTHPLSYSFVRQLVGKIYELALVGFACIATATDMNKQRAGNLLSCNRRPCCTAHCDGLGLWHTVCPYPVDVHENSENYGGLRFDLCRAATRSTHRTAPLATPAQSMRAKDVREAPFSRARQLNDETD